jgi:hypothetical protein
MRRERLLVTRQRLDPIDPFREMGIHRAKRGEVKAPRHLREAFDCSQNQADVRETNAIGGADLLSDEERRRGAPLIV